jgi:hypothetical protein
MEDEDQKSDLSENEMIPPHAQLADDESMEELHE